LDSVFANAFKQWLVGGGQVSVVKALNLNVFSSNKLLMEVANRCNYSTRHILGECLLLNLDKRSKRRVEVLIEWIDKNK
jgi:hypothetical protein